MQQNDRSENQNLTHTQILTLAFLGVFWPIIEKINIQINNQMTDY